MTKEKGARHTHEPDKLAEHRAMGEVGPLMASKVPVDMDSIFDEGIFENVRPPLAILVEGAFGSGKSTLAYHYCQKWADGNLQGMFELVALVYLRHPAVHSAGLDLTLHQLLLLASDREEGIDDIVTNVVQRIKDGLKFLLILDGWDEAPACLRAPPDPKYQPDSSYLGKLLRSVSPNTTILITSRPDSSIDLHNRPYVKRMEILGFTKESIHDYFQEALSTELSPAVLEDECRKLRDHLANYPAIESSCYIPLNAAILTLLYLQRSQSLPTTYFEMYYELLLCFVGREINTRQPERNLGAISSLDALPPDLMKQLKHISILAYEGVINNKVVFIQDELPSILLRGSRELETDQPAATTPVQQDLPAMGVLQKVQYLRIGHTTTSYYFMHRSIQEMLAAYCISQMGNDEQVRVFQTLLGEPRFAAVLQFYAGFTKLTNQCVRDIITGSDFEAYSKSSKLSLLSYIRCFFEAQIHDQSLYEKIILRLNATLDLSQVNLSPLDCMSVGYFLAFVLRNSRELSVDLTACSIDDHSLCLMIEELSKHAGAHPADALHGVIKLTMMENNIGGDILAYTYDPQASTTKTQLDTKGVESLARALAVNRSLKMLNIFNNIIGDKGVAFISTALKTNKTLKVLFVGGSNITDEGALSLAGALPNSSMEYCRLYWTSTHPDNTLKKIGESVRKTRTLRTLYLEMDIAPEAERRANEWMQHVEVGGKELMLSLEDSHLQELTIDISSRMHMTFAFAPHQFDLSLQALEATAATVNKARRQKGLPAIHTSFCER